jgi:hypothetical protein
MARNRELFLNSTIAVDYTRAQLTFTLPAPGHVAVITHSALETCTVIVDGQDIGFPPIQRRQIAAGGHTVAVKCQDGKGDSQR